MQRIIDRSYSRGAREATEILMHNDWWNLTVIGVGEKG
jgi:hypothetical protein